MYPDARVVQLHRDPLKTVPSTVSLMGTIRSMRCEHVDVDALAPLISFGYALMLDDTMDARASGELPDDQFVDVRYADLVADGPGTVGAIYRDLGIALPDELPGAVTRHLNERPQSARGVHRYALADTGLDPVVERRRFERYQQHYDVPDEA